MFSKQNKKYCYCYSNNSFISVSMRTCQYLGSVLINPHCLFEVEYRFKTVIDQEVTSKYLRLDTPISQCIISINIDAT